MIVIAYRIYHEPLVAIGFIISLLLLIATALTTGLAHIDTTQAGLILAPLVTALAGRPLVTPVNTTAPPPDEVDAQEIVKDGK